MPRGSLDPPVVHADCAEAAPRSPEAAVTATTGSLRPRRRRSEGCRGPVVRFYVTCVVRRCSHCTEHPSRVRRCAQKKTVSRSGWRDDSVRPTARPTPLRSRAHAIYQKGFQSAYGQHDSHRETRKIKDQAATTEP